MSLSGHVLQLALKSGSWPMHDLGFHWRWLELMISASPDNSMLILPTETIKKSSYPSDPLVQNLKLIDTIFVLEFVRDQGSAGGCQIDKTRTGLKRQHPKMACNQRIPYLWYCEILDSISHKTDKFMNGKTVRKSYVSQNQDTDSKSTKFSGNQIASLATS